MKADSTLRRAAFWHLPLILLGVTMLLPLVFMFSTALTRPGEAMQATDSIAEMIFPRSWRWSNFLEVWRVVPFLRYYVNSLLVAFCVTGGQVLTSAMAAFAFSRLNWPGRDKVFLAYLTTMMVPHSVTMIPNFVAMKLIPELLAGTAPGVDWLAMRHLTPDGASPVVGRMVGLDSYFALIVPGMFSAYGTFLLRQFFLSLPRELDEAAKIDGCGYWRLFWSVLLPLSLPGLATLTIFTFMGTWGSLLWPLVVTNQQALQTLPLGLQGFQGQYGTEWHLMMSAALLMLLPVFVIFLFGQRFFVSGLTVGAVKG